MKGKRDKEQGQKMGNRKKIGNRRKGYIKRKHNYVQNECFYIFGSWLL